MENKAVDYVIITNLLSCKICMVLQDSCKTGILIYHLARFALSDICSKMFFFQESCKISCKICIQLKNLARFEFRSPILQDSHQKQEIGKNLQRFAFNFTQGTRIRKQRMVDVSFLSLHIFY